MKTWIETMSDVSMETILCTETLKHTSTVFCGQQNGIYLSSKLHQSVDEIAVDTPSSLMNT